jgi:hypothetical protein
METVRLGTAKKSQIWRAVLTYDQPIVFRIK